MCAQGTRKALPCDIYSKLAFAEPPANTALWRVSLEGELCTPGCWLQGHGSLGSDKAVARSRVPEAPGLLLRDPQDACKGAELRAQGAKVLRDP